MRYLMILNDEERFRKIDNKSSYGTPAGNFTNFNRLDMPVAVDLPLTEVFRQFKEMAAAAA